MSRREQQRLAESMAAIFVAQRGRFLAQVKRLAGTTGNYQFQSLLVIDIQGIFGDGFLDFRHLTVDFLQQRRSPFHAALIDAGTQRQVLHVERAVRVLEEVIGIVSGSQKTGRATLADHVRFLERARKHDKGKHRIGRRTNPRDLRTDARIVIAGRGIELAGWGNFIRRIAGHHLVDGGRVVEQSGRRIAAGSNERGTIDRLRELRHHFGELNAGHLRWNRLEFAADIIRRVGLGIPDIQVAGATLEEDKNEIAPVPKPFLRAAAPALSARATDSRRSNPPRLSPINPAPPTRSNSRRL